MFIHSLIRLFSKHYFWTPTSCQPLKEESKHIPYAYLDGKQAGDSFIHMQPSLEHNESDSA